VRAIAAKMVSISRNPVGGPTEAAQSCGIYFRGRRVTGGIEHGSRRRSDRPNVLRVIRPKIRTLASKEDPCDGAGRRRSGRRLPRLEPWVHAVFQLGDCARRDAFVTRVCSGDIVRETKEMRKYIAPVESQACRLGVCVGRSTQTADTRASTGLLRLEFERFREGNSIAPVERQRKNG